MSELQRGQKVQVSFEARYVEQCDDANHLVTRDVFLRRGNHMLVPADATIEPIEDLRPGDVVLDAGDEWWHRYHGVWIKPGREGTYSDNRAVRPFKLHIRDGKPVLS